MNVKTVPKGTVLKPDINKKNKIAINIIWYTKGIKIAIKIPIITDIAVLIIIKVLFNLTSSFYLSAKFIKYPMIGV